MFFENALESSTLSLFHMVKYRRILRTGGKIMSKSIILFISSLYLILASQAHPVEAETFKIEINTENQAMKNVKSLLKGYDLKNTGIKLSENDFEASLNKQKKFVYVEDLYNQVLKSKTRVDVLSISDYKSDAQVNLGIKVAKKLGCPYSAKTILNNVNHLKKVNQSVTNSKSRFSISNGKLTIRWEAKQEGGLYFLKPPTH